MFLRYQCYYGYPPLTYLEYPILIAQDVILLLCIFHFNGNVKQATPYIAVLVSSWFVLALQKWIIDLAMVSVVLEKKVGGISYLGENLIDYIYICM